jgi:chemotaxis protein histidine kinase CheA
MGYGLIKAEERWPDGTIPYYFLLPPNNDNYYKAAVQVMHSIKLCMEEWMRYVNTGGLIYIRFVESNAQDATAKCIALKNPAAQNTAGLIGKAPGSDISMVMTINVSNVNQWQSIPHELGHVLGLAHENERNGFSDEHKWDANNPNPTLCLDKKKEDYDKEGKKNVPAMWHVQIKRVLDSRGSKYGTFNSDYDVQSIMHYSQTGIWKWNCPGDDVGAQQVCTALGRPLNRPLTNQVKAVEEVDNDNQPTGRWVPYESNNRWRPSAGDIAAVQKMYERTAVSPQQLQEKLALEKAQKEKALKEEQARKEELALKQKEEQLRKEKEEQAAKEQAAKEQAAKEQAAKEQAAKEQAAKEQAAKEQAAKEQAAQAQAQQNVQSPQQEQK